MDDPVALRFLGEVSLKPSILLISAMLLLVSGAASPTVAADDVMAFDVIRNGDRIGTHQIALERDGGETVVNVSTVIAVKIAFVTVYRFEHRSREEWRDGKLVSFYSETDDDGTQHRVTMQAVPAGLRVAADGETRIVEPAPLDSLWHNDALGADRMLSSLDGKSLDVRVASRGTEPVDVAGTAIGAGHVHIEGDLRRDVWFGPAGDLVRVEFPAKDGSIVTFRRVR